MSQAMAEALSGYPRAIVLIILRELKTTILPELERLIIVYLYTFYAD